MFACVHKILCSLHMYVNSPFCFLYISYGSDKENLFNNQERLLLVIISFILKTLVFYSVVILRGEMKC